MSSQSQSWKRSDSHYVFGFYSSEILPFKVFKIFLDLTLKPESNGDE